MRKSLVRLAVFIAISSMVSVLGACASKTWRTEHWQASEFRVSPDVPKRINLKVAFYTEVTNQDLWSSKRERSRATAELNDAALAMLREVFVAVQSVRKDETALINQSDLYIVFKGDYNKLDDGLYASVFDVYHARTFALIQSFSRSWEWEKLNWDILAAKEELRKDLLQTANAMMAARSQLLRAVRKKPAVVKKVVPKKTSCSQSQAELRNKFNALKVDQKMETCKKVDASIKILNAFTDLYVRCSSLDPNGHEMSSVNFKLQRQMESKARSCQ